MASMIYGNDFSDSTWLRPGALDFYVESSLLVDPYPPPPDLYVNKVWDPAAAAYVRWSTYFMDKQGTLYPGPSAWGTVAASYCVETITFLRLEA